MKGIQCACLLFILLPLPTLQDTDEATKVVQSILDPKKYDKRIRPHGPNNTVTEMSIRLNLISINDLDSLKQTLETTAWVSIKWKDPRLTWYNHNVGIDVISLPQDSIWHPDITLKNAFRQYVPFGNEHMFMAIYNGTVYWDPYEVFISSCDLNMKHFPFDVQKCEIHLTPWSFITKQVQFRSVKFETKNLEKSSQFELKNDGSEIKRISNSHVAIFKLQLKRKPEFIMMTTVLPILMLGVLNICVFVLPFHSGEKIGYAVTMLLALVVTLTFVSTILPDNSDSISYLAIYVTYQAIVSTVQTFITIILCMLYNYDSQGRPIPRWLVFLYRRLCCARNHAYDIKGHSNQVGDTGADGPATETVVPNVEQREDITWGAIVHTLDKVCLFLFSLIFVVITTIYFTMSVLNTD